MKFLFVGGPEHGRIQNADPGASGRWDVAHIPPLRIHEFSCSGPSIYIERSTYYIKEILFFEEKLTYLSIDGREDPNRILDAIIRPEVRDLMRRL